MKNAVRLKQVLLLTGDVGMLYLSLYLTLLIRYWQIPHEGLWQVHSGPFTLIFIGWILVFYIANLYDLRRAVTNADFFRNTGGALTVGALLAVTFFYINPGLPIAPKRNLFIFIVIFAGLFYLWRRLFNWFLKSYLPRNAVGIIGYNALAAELIRELSEKPHLGFTPAFIVNDQADTDSGAGQDRLPLPGDQRDGPAAVPVINGYADLADVIAKKKVTTVVFTADLHSSPELRNSLFACLPLKISYVSLPDFYESLTGKIPVDSINQMWFLENLSEGNKYWFDAVKRLADALLALLILLVTLPFWLLAAPVIKFGSPGPVFFRQIRTGQLSRQFTILKFRTMTTENNDHAPTAKKDRRITGFGRFLRRTRLDEIPQVINIIKGEMSFVGPRPERPELIEKLETIIPFYRERMLVKPGVTGPDQISGEYHSPSPEDTLKKLQYDLYYIKNRSLYLDVSIVLKTIATVLGMRGR